MLDQGALSVLACPRCKGELQAGPGEALSCASCQLSFPLRQGIPHLLLEGAHTLSRPEPASSASKSIGTKIKFIVVEGKNKGEAVEIEKGSCRAIGRSLDDTEKTKVFSVESTVTLDDVSKKLVVSFISKQFSHGVATASEGGGDLGVFHRQADIHFRDSAVSRLHAMLFYDEAGVGILDLVSKNGTFVNGVEVESKLLKKGDLVMVGTTKLRWE